jgi:MFS family permease
MSIHPFLRLVTTQPQLLADHVEAYAALVSEAMGEAISVWRRRAMLTTVALSLLAVGTVLGGVAAMLWAVLPAPDARASWVLVIVPTVPIVVSLLCLLACRREEPRAFAEVKQQMAADFMMLREVGSPERATS